MADYRRPSAVKRQGFLEGLIAKKGKGNVAKDEPARDSIHSLPNGIFSIEAMRFSSLFLDAYQFKGEKGDVRLSLNNDENKFNLGESHGELWGWAFFRLHRVPGAAETYALESIRWPGSYLQAADMGAGALNKFREGTGKFLQQKNGRSSENSNGNGGGGGGGSGAVANDQAPPVKFGRKGRMRSSQLSSDGVGGGGAAPSKFLQQRGNLKLVKLERNPTAHTADGTTTLEEKACWFQLGPVPGADRANCYTVLSSSSSSSASGSQGAAKSSPRVGSGSGSLWFLNAYERIRFNPDRGRIKFSNIPDTPEARSGGAGPQAWTLQGRKASEDILRAAATAVGPAAVADLQGDPEFEKEILMALRDAGTITDREVVKRQEEVMQGTYRWNWFRFRQYYISLVFTDIQGSTRLWERFGPKFKTIIDMHHRVLRTVLKRHHGYEVKTEGDAFMIVFTRPADAVLFGTDLQIDLLEFPWPDWMLEDEVVKDCVGVELNPDGSVLWRGLRVRVGCYSGAPDVERDEVTKRMDFYGPAVNRAARVEGQADGGQFLICETTYLHTLAENGSAQDGGELTSHLDADPSLREALTVVDCGVRELKGIALPEHVYQVLPNRLKARDFSTPPDPAAVAAEAAAEEAAQKEAREIARMSFEYPLEPQPHLAGGGSSSFNSGVPVKKRFDVFLCHLDSDAGDLCRQLHQLLTRKGYKVCHPSCSGGKLHLYSGKSGKKSVSGDGDQKGEAGGGEVGGEGDDDDDDDEDDDHLEPVRTSHCFLFVLSPHVFDSVAAGCWAELRAAYDSGLQLLPVRQEGATWSGKPLPDPGAPYVPTYQIDGRGGRFQIPPLLRMLLSAPKVVGESQEYLEAFTNRLLSQLPPSMASARSAKVLEDAARKAEEEQKRAAAAAEAAAARDRANYARQQLSLENVTDLLGDETTIQRGRNDSVAHSSDVRALAEGGNEVSSSIGTKANASSSSSVSPSQPKKRLSRGMSLGRMISRTKSSDAVGAGSSPPVSPQGSALGVVSSDSVLGVDNNNNGNGSNGRSSGNSSSEGVHGGSPVTAQVRARSASWSAPKKRPQPSRARTSAPDKSANKGRASGTTSSPPPPPRDKSPAEEIKSRVEERKASSKMPPVK